MRRSRLIVSTDLLQYNAVPQFVHKEYARTTVRTMPLSAFSERGAGLLAQACTSMRLLGERLSFF